MAPKRRKAPDPPLSRAALLPAALLAVFGLHFAAGLPFGFAVLGSAPFVALFLWAPVWVRRSADAFDRDAIRLLATGRSGELEARYARAVGLRMFGPIALRAARRAMVAAETGDAGAARTEFARAIGGWENLEDAPFALRLGYAHACHAVGDDAEAIAAYEKVLAERGALPRVRKNLAHALIRDGKGLRDALSVLDVADREASEATDKAELALLRAWALNALGQKKKAKRILSAHTEVDTPLAEEVREACGA
jgi:tetratricopeptide (TPR) repeat protein